MKASYEITEDINLSKKHNILQSKFVKSVVISLVFLLICAICFNVVYLLSINNIEKNESKAINSKSDVKIFLIEQKLRKDLNKININN